MRSQPPRPTDHLNALLRVELAAVLAYQQALRSMDGRLGGGSVRLDALATGHQHNVATLQACIRAVGGIPDAEPGPPWSTFALLRDELSVQQLLAAEESALVDYEAALGALDGDVRDLVELELIPRQRQNVSALSKILVDVFAT